MTPLYSIGTWDTERQAYTPQANCQSPWLNVDQGGLRKHLSELRRLCGYSAHRRRDSDGTHDDNDWMVLVERTDGMTEAAVLKQWER